MPVIMSREQSISCGIQAGQATSPPARVQFKANADLTPSRNFLGSGLINCYNACFGIFVGGEASRAPSSKPLVTAPARLARLLRTTGGGKRRL